MKTLDSVLSHIKKYNLISPGDSIVCGLSGGADSCAMVSILNRLKSVLDFTLICAHLNHGLRGREALRDELFSKTFAEKLGLPFYSRQVDVNALAEKLSLSLEDAGRKARYGFFSDLLKETGANKIATAHNKDDNAETILMHITRSSGIKGVCGILPERGNIIRPILNLSRTEIEDYCKESGIDYVTDSTNLTADFTRNKFRLEILPLLREVNPAVTDALCRLGEAATLQQDFIQSTIHQIPRDITENGVEIPLSALKSLHPALYPEFIRSCVSEILPEYIPPATKIVEFENLVSGKKTVAGMQLSPVVTARISYDKLIISKEAKTLPFEYSLVPGETLNIFGKQIFITDSPPSGGDAIPWDGINPITVRNRRPGDKMKIRKLTRKLQDLFVNTKTDRVLRDRLLIITIGEGIAWAETIGIDDSLCNIHSEKYIIIEPEDKTLC